MTPSPEKEVPQLPPEARQELEAFAEHLRSHQKGTTLDGCRFCAERNDRGVYPPPRAASPLDVISNEIGRGVAAYPLDGSSGAPSPKRGESA